MSYNKELNRRKTVASIIKRVVKITGLSGASRTFHRMAQVSFVCFFTALVTQIIALFLARSDSEKLFEGFSVLTFCGMAALKLRSLYFNYNNWLGIVEQADLLENDQLSDEIPRIENESGIEDDNENCFVVHINAYTEQFRSISVVVTKLYYFTLMVFIASPCIESVYWIINGVSVRPHILPGWSPFDEVSFIGYLTTVIMEFIAAFYCVVVHFGFDLTAFGLMIFLSGQFSLLREYSENIGGSGNHYSLTTERDIRTHYRIVKAHKILVNLENLLSKLDKELRLILGIYYLLAMLTLCTVALRLNSEDLSVLQLISLLQYTSGSLLQLFFFCYYGDMVLQKSSVGMGEGPYAASHWCLSPRVRRELSLLGVGMARERRLRAGPLQSLNLPSFIQIIRAAYSYYAVVRKQSK